MEYIVQLCSGKKSWSYQGGMRARGFKILHPSRWTMLSLGRCLSTTNISYAIIRCTVPPTVSPAWVKGCREHILSTLYATCAYLVDWNGLSVFTLDDTTFWFILYQTKYVPLFNYNILTNIPIPVDIIPSPLQSRRRAHPQWYTQQLPPIIYHLLISTHTRHPDPKQVLGTWSEWFSHVFFYY